MSHGLSNRTTGEAFDDATDRAEDAAMFYATDVIKLPPWHKFGQPVAGALNSADAIVKGGLDWEVKKRPVFNVDMVELKGYFETYRSDNGANLGIVGNRYEIIQNKDAFAFMDAVLMSAQEAARVADPSAPYTAEGAWFDTAGALFNGKRVWMNARLPQSIKIAGDIVQPYFLITTSHDGTGQIDLVTTPTRTVCQNTLNMAINGADKSRHAKIRHTRNYEARLQKGAQMLGFVTEYYNQFRRQAEELAALKFSKSAFESLMLKLMPLPEDATKRQVTIAKGRWDKMMQAFNADDLDNVRFTGWGAYNAFADYADHMRKVRGNDPDAEARAFIRTFEDTKLKDRALDLILASA